MQNPTGDYKLAKVFHRCAKMFVSLAESEFCRGERLAESHKLTRVMCNVAKTLVNELEVCYSIRKN